VTAPPDPAVVVQNQLFPPGPQPPDAIEVYAGADPVKNGFKSWIAWDVRGPLLRLMWDLLRFQQMPRGKMPADLTTPIGLRDSVNVILNMTYQNNQILQRLAKQANINISDILGG
jgi:hypothetical protein